MVEQFYMHQPYFCRMKLLRRLTRIELVLVYLVIIAGSVVRMTGSGMGCPDWPKCFGYLIPPTERAQLEWQPEKLYDKGQIIIVNESLQVAKTDFITNNSYSEVNWESYTKHDYAVFNPFHTWTEYINRLMGALSGIPMFLLFVISVFYVRCKPLLLLLSFAGLFMLGFEAWLGKLVVDGNLIPGSITIHMMGALLIVAILLVLLRLLSPQNLDTSVSPKIKPWLFAALALGLVQIVLGTQVREQVDHLTDAGVNRAKWIGSLEWEFYVHRSFSILVLLTNGMVFYFGRKSTFLQTPLRGLLAIVFIEILLGILLSYFDFPKFAQPLHLLLAVFMFGLHVYLFTRLVNRKKSVSVDIYSS